MSRALLDVAATLAEEAGRIAAERFFADDFDIAVKRDGSEVTDADVAVEQMLRAELRRRFPDRGWLTGGGRWSRWGSGVASYGGGMEVLASRVLLRPTDLDRSRAFYRDTLKLPIFREFTTPGGTGTVFFIGGGYLEVSGHADAPSSGDGIELWLQVRDIEVTRCELDGVTVLREPKREPWGLIEMWITDPDGIRICVVEVTDDHPMRSR